MIETVIYSVNIDNPISFSKLVFMVLVKLFALKQQSFFRAKLAKLEEIGKI